MSQNASNVRVAIKKQVSKGTRATGGSGIGFNVAATQGIQGAMAPIVSPTIGNDGMASLDGLGSRKGNASYPMVLGVLKQDVLWPALMRENAWLTLPDITQTQVTSVTTATDGIVAASGSLLTLGLRRGMRIKATGLPDAANNGKWLNVLGVTASKVTTGAGSLVANASPDTSFTITIAKHIYMSGTPGKQYWTIEEWHRDILASEILEDAVLNKFEFSAGPDAKILGTPGFLGRDFFFEDVAGTEVLTSPAFPSGNELEMSDGLIITAGIARNIATDLSGTYDMGGDIPSVIGSQVGPDVSLSPAKFTGSIGMIREDLVEFKRYRAKSPWELFVVMREPEAEPADFISLYGGNCLYQTPSKGIAQDGLMQDTLPFVAGRDEGGGDRARTVLLISSSAP